METQFNDSCFKSKEEIKYFFIILQILFDLIIYFRTCEICGQKFQAEIAYEEHHSTHFAPTMPKRYHKNITFRPKRTFNFN